MREGQAAIEDVADGMRWLQLLLALAPRWAPPGYQRWLRCWMDMASLMAADMLGVDGPPFETWRRPGPNDGLLDRRSAQRLEAALLEAGFDPLGLREGSDRG